MRQPQGRRERSAARREELDQRVQELRRGRPRNRFVFFSVSALCGLMAGAWVLGDFAPSGWLSARRWHNLQRFMGELVPYPLQGQSFDWGVALSWLTDILADKGWEAAAVTLSISVAAIVLAGILGGLLSLPAARTFSSPRPFSEGVEEGQATAPGGSSDLGRPRSSLTGRPPVWPVERLLWMALCRLTRTLLVFVRAIPEYVWAFIFLALLGPSAWPAVLALALHNTGILGKLNAEAVENLDRRPLLSLRGLGAGRLQIALAAILPLTLSRFLLFLFYRWETCVREATVLGLLGIVSLGYWIQDARARHLYDEMLVYILLGSALVILGDFLSAAAREAIRRAS